MDTEWQKKNRIWTCRSRAYHVSAGQKCVSFSVNHPVVFFSNFGICMGVIQFQICPQFKIVYIPLSEGVGDWVFPQFGYFFIRNAFPYCDLVRYSTGVTKTFWIWMLTFFDYVCLFRNRLKCCFRKVKRSHNSILLWSINLLQKLEITL